jgi:type I restriction enzyme M protein
MKSISEDEYRGREEYALEPGDVLFNNTNSVELVGKTCLIETSIRGGFSNHMTRIRVNRDICVPRFLSLLLHSAWRKGQFTERATRWVGQAGINARSLGAFEIPLPPLQAQKQIVAEIEGYQKIIDGARAVLDNYHPHITIQADWPMVELGRLCTIKSGGTPERSNERFWNGSIPWVTTSLIDYRVIEAANEFITTEGLNSSSTWIVPKGTVLMAMYGQGLTRGRVAILGIDAAINQACAAFQLKGDSLDTSYLFRVLESRYEDLRRISDARGGNQSNLSAQVLKEYSIPLPPLTTQETIVAEIDAEQALVNANRELIARFEKKIQATLARIWGEAEPAATEA